MNDFSFRGAAGRGGLGRGQNGRWFEVRTRHLSVSVMIFLTELIFVTEITNYIRGEKLSHGEIWSFYEEFEQFVEFYQSLCRFCSKSM